MTGALDGLVMCKKFQRFHSGTVKLILYIPFFFPSTADSSMLSILPLAKLLPSTNICSIQPFGEINSSLFTSASLTCVLQLQTFIMNLKSVLQLFPVKAYVKMAISKVPCFNVTLSSINVSMKCNRSVCVLFWYDCCLLSCALGTFFCHFMACFGNT